MQEPLGCFLFGDDMIKYERCPADSVSIVGSIKPGYFSRVSRLYFFTFNTVPFMVKANKGKEAL